MKIGSSHNILCRKNSVTREICKPMENTQHRREREMQDAANRTYVSIGRFLDVRVLDDVTVKMNQTEEVEAERRSETTQHPARHIITTLATVNCCLKQTRSSADAETARHSSCLRWRLLLPKRKPPHFSILHLYSSAEFRITGYYDPDRFLCAVG